MVNCCKIFIITAFISIVFYNKVNAQSAVGNVKIIFANKVKDATLALDSVTYINSFGEAYQISKLKYYISNIVLSNLKNQFAENESYHLIDANNKASLQFNFFAKTDTYTTISFLIGVDSIKNVSGAQTGALDVTNGMFWTWNSGYIMFKLEGKSAASKIVNNKIEYHIGGFFGLNNTVKKITLQLPKPITLQKKKSCKIIIDADIDKIWNSTNQIKITENAATMSPGDLAKKIADNYASMFFIKQ